MSLSTKEEYIAQCIASNKTREECEQLWNEANKPAPADQQTKEEYIKQCVAGGKTHVECEASWNESHEPPTGDYADLYRKYELLKARDDENILYLRQATKIIKQFQDEKKGRDFADKHRVAVELEAKTEGRLKYGDLMNESPRDLDTMRKAVDSATPKNFVSVSALLAESDAKKKPKLTTGEWDPEKKKWVGGIIVG